MTKKCAELSAAAGISSLRVRTANVFSLFTLFAEKMPLRAERTSRFATDGFGWALCSLCFHQNVLCFKRKIAAW